MAGTGTDLPVRVAVPVNPDGTVGARLGQASSIAVTEVNPARDRVCGWAVHQVDWDQSYARGPHATHHARVLRFLREQAVELVVAGGRVGIPMARSLQADGIDLVLGASGDARAAARAAATGR